MAGAATADTARHDAIQLVVAVEFSAGSLEGGDCGRSGSVDRMGRHPPARAQRVDFAGLSQPGKLRPEAVGSRGAVRILRLESDARVAGRDAPIEVHRAPGSSARWASSSVQSGVVLLSSIALRHCEQSQFISAEQSLETTIECNQVTAQCTHRRGDPRVR